MWWTGKVDYCGLCLPQDNPQFNKSCTGCDGVPNSGVTPDVCGVCGGTGSRDVCGNCYQANDTRRVTNGGVDACGMCLSYTDSRFNKSCVGCDGVPNSGVTYDECGECGGSKTKTECGRGLSVGAIVAISVTAFVVVGLGVFFFLKRQQAKMRDDIDALLAQYQPLEGSARPRPPVNYPTMQNPTLQSPGQGTTTDDVAGQSLIGTAPPSDL